LFYIELILSLVGSLLLIICVLVRVAFLTLLERKVLGYIQIRKGPNKVGLIGIPQPFCDAIKLFTKEQTYPLLSNYLSYYISPIFSFLLSFVFLIGGYNFLSFYYYQIYIWFLIILFPIALVWLIISLAETNRTPFDFAEGESELVSGFNVEYRRGGFALIFLAEYARILFISILFCVIFLGCDVFNLLFYLKLIFISFVFIWVRGTLPRFRYDKLMYLAWKCFLSFSLNYLIFFIGFKILLFSLLLWIKFSKS